jgi:hypothetical protein
MRHSHKLVLVQQSAANRHFGKMLCLGFTSTCVIGVPLQTFVHNLSAAIGPSTWTISELYYGWPFKETAQLIADFIQKNNSDSAFSFPMTEALRRTLRVRTVTAVG